jgi:hypothetical protein
MIGMQRRGITAANSLASTGAETLRQSVASQEERLWMSGSNRTGSASAAAQAKECNSTIMRT